MSSVSSRACDPCASNEAATGWCRKPSPVRRLAGSTLAREGKKGGRKECRNYIKPCQRYGRHHRNSQKFNFTKHQQLTVPGVLAPSFHPTSPIGRSVSFRQDGTEVQLLVRVEGQVYRTLRRVQSKSLKIGTTMLIRFSRTS